MGVISTNQFFDYPMYLVEIGVPASEDSVVAFWIADFSGPTAINGQTEPVYDGFAPSGFNNVGGTNADFGLTYFGSAGTDAVASLLSAIKTWAEAYDWSSLQDGFSYDSISVTKFDESSANVTPG